jgi:hypothetical protein
MVPDEVAQKPTGKPGSPSKPAVVLHCVLKLANEEKLREQIAQLPPGTKLLGLFNKDGKLLAAPRRPGEEPPPNRLEESPPPHKPPAPQK